VPIPAGRPRHPRTARRAQRAARHDAELVESTGRPAGDRSPVEQGRHG